MCWTSKNSFNTFKHHLRTDRIHCVVILWPKILMRLRHNQYRFTTFNWFSSVCFQYCLLNVLPFISCIVSIKKDYLFCKEIGVLIVFGSCLCLTTECNCIEIVLICFGSDNIDSSIHINTMNCHIFFSVWCKNFVVWYFKKFNLNWFFDILYFSIIWVIFCILWIETCPFRKILNFRVLLCLNILIKSLVEIILTCST